MITIIVPCFNEESGVPNLCERLEPALIELQKGSGVELIFIDDGSTDQTVSAIQREAAEMPYKIVRHNKNLGVAAAFRTGFAEARGDEIVTIDSDCTYEPGRIAAMLTELRRGADVVTASPYHPNGLVLGVPRWRLFLSSTLSKFYAVVLPQRLFTYTSCFRAYRAHIVRDMQIEHNGFLGVTEILVKAMLCGAKIAEMPECLSRRRFGRSKIRVLTVSLSHMGFLLQLALRRGRSIWLSKGVVSPHPETPSSYLPMTHTNRVFHDHTDNAAPE